MSGPSLRVLGVNILYKEPVTMFHIVFLSREYLPSRLESNPFTFYLPRPYFTSGYIYLEMSCVDGTVDRRINLESSLSKEVITVD